MSQYAALLAKAASDSYSAIFAEASVEAGSLESEAGSVADSG